MRSLSLLALEIYQKVGKQYTTLNERKEATKRYILNEITQWSIKSTHSNGVYAFKPNEFKGTEDSPPFEVRLVFLDGWDKYELKFGNLNAPTQQEQYEWVEGDPYRMQKALFLTNVLKDEVLPLILDGTIPGVMFTPYDEDGLGDDRLSYFQNMFSKVGKDKLKWIGMGGMYFITKRED